MERSMKYISVRYIIVFLIAFVVSSCRDELMEEDFIGEGKAYISATLDFRPMNSALDQTRMRALAAGNALKDIACLHVLLYDFDTKNLVNKWKIEEYTVSDENRTDADAENGKSAETQTKQAAFKLPEEIDFGRYYMYAVANIPDLFENNTYSEAILTVDGLKNIILVWDSENMTANGQMIGYFTKNSALAQYADESLVVNEKKVKLHAWLRRAASKVTIAYDGTNLKDDVSVYIMAASIKDIPTSCFLGKKNTPVNADSLIHDGGMIKYFEGDVQPGLDNFLTDYKAVVSNNPSNRTYGSNHNETAEALFFYENMQGEGKDKKQTAAGPGNNDGADYGIGYPDPEQGVEGSGWKDEKYFGTYIEVDAIYRSENSERPGVGLIKYRFMLGKNITTNYDAERNHHYKLTLKFNNFANDCDWHIGYMEQILDVTEPQEMNYQGKIFVPEYLPGTANYNSGHNFIDNTVTVTSYVEDSDGKMVNWRMEYDENGDGNFQESCSWIEPVITDGPLPYIKNVSFRITPQKEEIDIDSLLQNAPQKGSETAPYNLANPGETVDPANATIKCTANCYIVDAPGYYILPLVYGNAYHNFNVNKNAYTYTGSYTGDQILPTFKNYLGKEINSPDIITDTKITPQSAFLVWQDEPDLIPYNCWIQGSVIKYIPEAYGGKGGIQFYIDGSNIKQGNAVIALGDGLVNGINYPPIMWSWHIWVTNFSYLEEEDKNIEVTGHNPSQKFSLLPVNLGWCSDHGDKVKYYRAREFRVKFIAGAKEKIIDFKLQSHIAFTRGNSPYYQWGRKDPFVGANGNVINKPRYYSVGWSDSANPSMISDSSTPDGDRYTTREAVNNGILIQNPHKWHNPRRKKNDVPGGNDYLSDNEIYRNLWEGRIGVQPGTPTLKTVYDPCPVGYQVPHVNAVSGFTTTGDNTNTPFEWYDVRVENIADYDAATGTCGENGKYSKGLFEFYTNPDKLKSIIFPESGYRDWDDWANAYQVDIEAPIGYIWMAGNKDGNDNRSYNFEFSRKDYVGSSYIRPRNNFYPNNGFPIRPCVYDNHSVTIPK